MTRPITSDEIETVIKNLPTSKSPGPECFTGDLCQTFREELTSFLLKRFHKNWRGRNTPSSFYEATITLIPKPDKDIIKEKKRLEANNTDEHRCNNHQYNTSKQYPQNIKRITHHDEMGFIPGMQGFFNMYKSIYVIHYINK